MINVYEYNINQHALNYFINGDLSYLDYSGNESELEQTLQFEKDIIAEHGQGYFSYDDEQTHFTKCAITGLMSDCVTFQYIVINAKEE